MFITVNDIKFKVVYETTISDYTSTEVIFTPIIPIECLKRYNDSEYKILEEIRVSYDYIPQYVEIAKDLTKEVEDNYYDIRRKR